MGAIGGVHCHVPCCRLGVDLLRTSRACKLGLLTASLLEPYLPYSLYCSSCFGLLYYRILNIESELVTTKTGVEWRKFADFRLHRSRLGRNGWAGPKPLLLCDLPLQCQDNPKVETKLHAGA